MVFPTHTLEELGIANAALLKRPLKESQVQSLLQSPTSEWGLILVTATDKGYGVMDGLHRREAATQRKLEGLDATCKAYKSENDVIDAAFEANIRHGLSWNAANRSNYVWFLYKAFPGMKQEDIAAKAKVTQATVSKAIARREKEAAQPTAGEELHENIIKALKTTSRETSKFLEYVKDLPEHEQRAAIMEAIDDPTARDHLLQFAHLLEHIFEHRRRRQ